MNCHLHILVLALAVGCSSTPDPLSTDAGIDAALDVATDVPADTLPDTPARLDAAAVITLEDIEARVLRPHCAIPSCHASAEPTGRMRLDEDFPRATLRDIAAMGVSCRDQGLVRVVPGDPAHSLLYRKISEDAPPCGSRMPQAAPPLPPELIALVHDWIAAGAP